MTTQEAIKVKDEIMNNVTSWSISWVQFRSCQAYTGQVNGRYTLIKSYATVVGLIDHEEKVVYELGKWSQTTSQQIRKIKRFMVPHYEFVAY